MQNFNLERTRAPRRVIPWWVYVGSVLISVLLIWAVVKILPGRKSEKAPVVAKEEALPQTSTDSLSIPPAVEPSPMDVEPEVEETKAASPAVAAAPNPSAPATTTAPSISQTGAPQLQDALAAKAAGDYVKAREQALQIWKTTQSESIKHDAESILNEVDIELVLSPRVMNEKIEYTVAPGDSLEKIARKFNTTIDLIRKSNNIKGSMIRAGDRLRIFQGKFKLSVSKSDNDLVVYMNDEFFKRYRVGTGAYNKTPVGDFVINDRIAQPTWWRPDGKEIPYGDPENLLGTHWLSINVKGYGLHGTWQPETIGKQASAGCIRMLNDDIEQLFTLLTIGTPVSIRD